MKTSLVARVTAAAFVIILGLVTACGSDTPSSGGDDTFCSTAKASKCPDPTACDTTIANGCADLGKVLTDSTVNAARDCLESGVCGIASCVSRAQKSSVISDAHKKLADDYCTTCATTVENCAASFYQRGKKLPGLLFLPYNSTVIDEIDSRCTGSSGCEAKFVQCANDVVTEVVGQNLAADVASCVVESFKTEDGTGGPTSTVQVLKCTADNCQGCCRNDQCFKGDELSGCGKAGAACAICGGAQSCTPDGNCKDPCGPDNCRGCCDGDTCKDGNAATACGERGGACEKCPGTFVCSNHSCIDASCQATCDGCCTGSTCNTGTTAGACGFGGNACIDCGFGRKCASASCVLDTTSLWDFYLSFAVIPEKNRTGGDWDFLAGLPDVYAKVFSSEGTTTHSGQTTVQNDSRFPFWAETPIKSVKASELLSNLSIEFWDSDEIVDDFMGGCSIPLTAAKFDGSLQDYTCQATSSGVQIQFYYRINPHK